MKLVTLMSKLVLLFDKKKKKILLSSLELRD